MQLFGFGSDVREVEAQEPTRDGVDDGVLVLLGDPLAWVGASGPDDPLLNPQPAASSDAAARKATADNGLLVITILYRKSRFCPFRR